MNKIIGITGGMASGKTTIAKKIIKDNSNFKYIDVDIFRRSLYDNEDYCKELKEVIPELKQYNIDSIILNKYIYSNETYMKEYKDILYKYLWNYINSFKDRVIVVDWALIINDDLINKFNKIIYVKASYDKRLQRLSNSDLSKEEILERFKLQEIDNIEDYVDDNFIIVDNDGDINIDMINRFINGMECKFTLPNGEGKAIWEITHKCNYGCAYCIFSCNNHKRIDNELSTEECFHIIDQLVKKGYKHLKITGGEPFIRKDIIDILQYASDKLITDISTNASLITSEIVEQLNNIKLKMIHVSLDGNKLEHESVRGTNTYDRTIKGLEALKRSKNKVRIGTVIHYNNQDTLEKIVVDANKLQAQEIIFSIMEPVEGQDKSLEKTKTNEELISSLDKIKDKYKDRITVNYNFGKQPNYVCRCPAGDKFIYINNFGQVSPCPWVHEVNKKCISNKSLRNSTLDEVLNDNNLAVFLKSKKEGKCYRKI